MGLEAEIDTDDEDIETVETEEVEETDEAEAQAEATDDTQEAESEENQEETEEIEIVRDGDTQPEKGNEIGIRKRINKLNAKIDAAKSEADTANTELEVEREKRKLLELRLQQVEGGAGEPAEPKVEDFEDGYGDPEYQKKLREYNNHLISKRLADESKKSAEATQQQQRQEATSANLEAKQVAHYERAAKLGVKDYEATEDKAIEALGKDAVNHLIDNFEDTHVLLYYLGKNPAEAEKLSNLLKENPIKGVAEIGRLQSTIKVKPKRRKPAASPDEDLQSSGRTSSKKGKGPTFE